jgi:hypothetical protein
VIKDNADIGWVPRISEAISLNIVLVLSGNIMVTPHHMALALLGV